MTQKAQPEFFTTDGEFKPVAVAARLWDTLGDAYAGMEFSLPSQADDMTLQDAVTGLYLELAGHTESLAQLDVDEQLRGVDFLVTVGGMLRQLASEAAEFGGVEL